MIHKSRTQITNTLRLLQLGKKAQKMLSEGKITAGHAKVLVGLDEKEQNMLVDSIIGQKLSVRDVEAMTKQMKGKDVPVCKKEPSEPPLELNGLKSLLNDLGYRCSASGRKITIEFADEDDVNEFMQRLL